MKLGDQVVSLELAKRLKELGVKQESHFVWYTNGDNAHLLDCPDGQRPMEAKTYSAFTVAELGEMLPPRLEIDGVMYWLDLAKNGPEPKIGRIWDVGYARPGEEWQIVFEADTEVDARAKMLIYLLENKLAAL